MRSRPVGTPTKLGSGNWRGGWQRSNANEKERDGVSSGDASKVIYTDDGTSYT